MVRVWGRLAYLTGLPIVGELVIGIVPAKADLDAPIDFSMPAGDLGSTLVAISRQGKVMISFPSEIVAGRSAAALQGRISARQALARVLAGSGLRLVPGAGGSVTIIRDADPAAAAVPAGDIAAIDVTDESAMSRYGDVGFQAGDAGDTVRIAGAPASQVALTVNTVTSSVIRSQGLTSAADAVQNVSGVSLNAASGGATSFVIRGFTTTDVYVNGQGVSNTAAGTAGYSQVPIDDIERVEVLKGPTSILGGASSNGGAVNVSTKQPTSTEIRAVTVRYGSYNYKTLAFDFGGPVPGTENLTYRFNLSGNHADQGYAGYRDPHEALISPVVKWDNGETSVLVGVRYVDQKRVPAQYSFITTDASQRSPILRIPRGTPNVNTGLNYLDRSLTIYSDQSHRFGDVFGFDATLNNKFQFQESSDRFNYYAWQVQSAANSQDGLYRARQTFGQLHFSQILNKSDLTLTYDAGFAKQTSKFGIDYYQKNIQFSTNQTADFRTNPLTGLPTQPLLVTEPIRPSAYTEYDSSGVGYYYLEKFDTLEDRLHILGTVRYDANRFVTGSGQRGNRVYSDPTHPEGLSWSAGAVFDVTPYFSVYGNRSSGFVPVLGAPNGVTTPPPPEIRDNAEVGGRFYLFDKKLTVTAAYFNQSAKNVSICSPTDPTCTTLILVGGLDSTGFEMDFQGEVLPGLNLIGSFASTVAKYRDAKYLPPATTTPQYTASLWATYTFQTGLFQGLTLGLGGRGNSNSGTNLFNGNNLIFSVPGYVTADALIGYDYDNWSIQFKINNILDKYYYQPSFSGNYIGIGEGRNFLMSARYAFN